MRFPSIADFVVGIKQRMKSFGHVHMRMLWRLAALYGDDAFQDAAETAQSHRAFNAHSVSRLLARRHPMPPDEPIEPLHGASAAHALDDIDSGSLDDYADLDEDGEEDNHGQ